MKKDRCSAKIESSKEDNHKVETEDRRKSENHSSTGATALPPLNPANIGKVWPITAKSPKMRGETPLDEK